MMWITRVKVAGAIGAVLIGGAAAVAGAHGLHRKPLPIVSVRDVTPAAAVSGAQTVKLTNGISVNSLAICPGIGGNSEQWWDPGGKWLPEVPSRNNGFHRTIYERVTTGKPLSLLLGISGPDAGDVGTVGYVVDPDGQLDKQGFLVKGAPEDNGSIGPDWASTSCMYVGLPPDKKTFDYWFGVAVGPWKTSAVTTYTAPKAGEIFHTKDRFAYSATVTLDDRPTVSYQDNAKLWHRQSLLGASAPLGAVDRWITAVDANGHDVHLGYIAVDSHGIRSVRMEPEDLAKVAEFRLQTRPYVWAEFKNIHTQPMTPAPKTILIDDPAPLPGYSHTFHGGVGVQLTAVHRYPIEGGEWWRPDGQALPGAPRSFQHLSSNGVTVKAHRRLIAFSVNGPPGSTYNIVWKAEGSNQSPFTVRQMGTEQDVNQSPVGDYDDAFPEDPDTTKLTLGLAEGPWKTVATKDVLFTPEALSHRDVDPSKDFDGDVSLRLGSKVRLQYKTADGRAVDDLLATPDTSTMACRLLLIMQDGSSTPIHQSGGYGTDILYNFAFDPKSAARGYNSDIDLTKIRQIQVQARPYEWAEFSNIALRPGK